MRRSSPELIEWQLLASSAWLQARPKDAMLVGVSTLAWAGGLALLELGAALGLAAGCSDSPRPARYPPPQPAASPPLAAQPEPAPTPAPTPEAGNVQVGAAMLVGGIDMSREAMDQSGDDFVAVLSANQSALRRCYGAVATRLPGLRGEVKVKVVIHADGSAYQVQHLGGDLTDPELVSCTIQALEGLVYRSHAGQLFVVETALQYSP